MPLKIQVKKSQKNRQNTAVRFSTLISREKCENCFDISKTRFCTFWHDQDVIVGVGIESINFWPLDHGLEVMSSFLYLFCSPTQLLLALPAYVDVFCQLLLLLAQQVHC